MSEDLKSEREWTVQPVLNGLDGSMDDLRQLYEIWQRQAPQLLGEIRSAIEQGDGRKLEIAAHTFKGSLMILNAENAIASVAELESLGRQKSTAIDPGLFSQLEEEVAAVVQSFDAFMRLH